jgi:hypothetical protein
MTEGRRLQSSGSGYGQVVKLFEKNNEVFGMVKFGKVFD